MTNDEFTALIVRLELLRGACNTPAIKRADIAKSIQALITELIAKHE